MLMRRIYDEVLAQASYLIGCQKTGEAIVIDPVRDIDQYYALASAHGLTITGAVDTHIHADYLSGLQAFADAGVHVYASAEGGDYWQYEWLKNSQYNYTLLRADDFFTLGNIRFQALHTPGHMPEHLSYLVFDNGVDEPLALLSGDFLFVGDLGRPDLLETAAGQIGAREPSARQLFDSTKVLKSLSPDVQVWPAHGAGSACGKGLGSLPSTTVGYELRHNVALQHTGSKADFVSFILTGQPSTPAYFGRMKTGNRNGIKVWQYHAPPQISVVPPGSILLDVRANASGAKNIIAAPLNTGFPASAGSFMPENASIVLVAQDSEIELAVRTLARMGFDKIVGVLSQSSQALAAPMPQASFTQIPPGAFILDVRAPHEYDSGHISGAVNIAHTRLLAEHTSLPKNRKIFVHCASGARASSATGALSAYGFDVVKVSEPLSLYTGELIGKI